MAEHTEVRSSCSNEEVYENRWRKGLEGWDRTDTIYLILEDSKLLKRGYLFEGRLEIDSKE